MNEKNSETVRIFIGSGEASRVECKVLLHSIRMSTDRDLDIWIYNGTHNAIERNAEAPVLAPLSLELKYRSVTEFSLFRYLIPQLCDFKGRAIYLDSDMVCLDDLGELFDTDLQGCDFLCKRGYTEGCWATSVMLMDCSKCRFDLPALYKQIDSGQFSYLDFSRFSPKFRSFHKYMIGQMDPEWNVFDFRDQNTKLLHFTNLYSQPWKFGGHKFEAVWYESFHQAIRDGFISDEDIRLSKMRAYVRQDLPFLPVRSA